MNLRSSWGCQQDPNIKKEERKGKGGGRKKGIEERKKKGKTKGKKRNLRTSGQKSVFTSCLLEFGSACPKNRLPGVRSLRQDQVGKGSRQGLLTTGLRGVKGPLLIGRLRQSTPGTGCCKAAGWSSREACTAESKWNFICKAFALWIF